MEQAALDPETMSPLQKAVMQDFHYRDMLEARRVATVSESAQKQTETCLPLPGIKSGQPCPEHHRNHPQRQRTRLSHIIQTP